MDIHNEFTRIYHNYKNNNNSHAYLITTNNVEKCLDELLLLLKKVYCNDTFDTICNKCNLCNLINKGNFPNIKLIEPDGSTIKKDQIRNLKYSFSSKSQFSHLNTYIIKNAEKMNKESNNSILKFLEEPESNIIGFFITNNKNNILDTIISRCENIVINYSIKNIYDELGLSNENYNSMQNLIKEYLYELEVLKTKSILINKELILSNYNDKQDIIIFFKIILNIYNNAMRSKLLNEKELYDNFDYIYNQNYKKLINKNEVLVDILNQLNFNTNIELILDRFVIEIGEINNESVWSNIQG